MAEIKHRVGINGSAAEIYSLLTTDKGLNRWWTTETSGAGASGSIIHFHFGSVCVDFEITELIPDRLVRWRHAGKTPLDWMGSEIIFELQQQEIQTILLFSHYNWGKSDEFLAHCSTKWVVLYPYDQHINFDE